MPTAYQLNGVGYSYGAVRALADLTVAIAPGERVALLGTNGSGKSTLLRLLGGLLFAQRGAIQFFGDEVNEGNLNVPDIFFRFRKRVGIVFQNPDVQLFNANVFDELAFGPLQLGWERKAVREAVERTLETMSLTPLRDRAPHQLSGGEKKRVALASVLVTDPEVLLLDEPVAALDRPSQDAMLELLASWKDSGRTVITATHELEALEWMADRCLILQNGALAGERDIYSLLHDLDLLMRTGLMRPQRHRHEASSGAHGHLHS